MDVGIDPQALQSCKYLFLEGFIGVDNFFLSNINKRVTHCKYIPWQLYKSKKILGNLEFVCLTKYI